MLRHFAIDCGYVENSSNSVVLMYHPEGFYTAKEAAENLRGALLKVVDNLFEKKDCCKKTGVDAPQANFCNGCGNSLVNYSEEFLNERTASLYQDFHHGDVDGTYEMYEAFQAAGWEMYRSPNETNKWTLIHHFDRWLEDYPDWEYGCFVQD